MIRYLLHERLNREQTVVAAERAELIQRDDEGDEANDREAALEDQSRQPISAGIGKFHHEWDKSNSFWLLEAAYGGSFPAIPTVFEMRTHAHVTHELGPEAGDAFAAWVANASIDDAV